MSSHLRGYIIFTMPINRIAVCVFFFVNGFLYANWTARLPEVQRFFDVSNTRLGTMLFTIAIGAVVAMPITGWLTVKFGSMRVTQTTGLIYCSLIPLLIFTPNLTIASISFFAIGLMAGSMDVAMNGQAVFVERAYKKPIMSSFHAVFSVGMALGAGAGAIFAKMDIALFSHFLMVAIVGVVANVWAATNLIDDRPSVAKSEESSEEEEHFMLPTKAVLPLGIVAFCAMTGEGAMADWSAIFMNKVLAQTESYSALAFGAFGTAMTIGRIFGDGWTTRFGKSKLLIYSSIFSMAGLALVVLTPLPELAFVGFFLVGIGLANVVPIVYSTAGNLKGIEPSVGIAMATTVGYAGFFVGPPTIGFLSDQFGLRLGLCFVLVLFFAMLVLVMRRKT
ncbi:MAG: MFS transporter [Bacteroidota bacterium]